METFGKQEYKKALGAALQSVCDNRDNSRDSRYWGFVPDENLVGKAVAIWISFEFDRAPDSWLPSWVPSGVRFSRVGGIQ